MALPPFPSWTMRLISSVTAVTASASPFLAENSEHVVSPSALDCVPLGTIVGARGSALLPGNEPSVYSPAALSDGARTKSLSVPSVHTSGANLPPAQDGPQRHALGESDPT